jgi:hypothetical protein
LQGKKCVFYPSLYSTTRYTEKVKRVRREYVYNQKDPDPTQRRTRYTTPEGLRSIHFTLPGKNLHHERSPPIEKNPWLANDDIT